MKKTILSIVLLLCAVLSVKAQDKGNITTAVAEQKPAATVGYFSYGNIITGIPDYAIAQQQIEELRVKYEAEAERVKKDFNDKYEAFLEGQKDFPPTILKKRQTELQELMQKNIAFKEESRRLLSEAERDIFAPLHDKISMALDKIGSEYNLTLIVNTDSDACPYINPSRSIDITDKLISLLGAK